jgi:hypothetical protein
MLTVKRNQLGSRKRRRAQYLGGGLGEAVKSGERGWTRTSDPCLKRALLYQLSYAPALPQYYCIIWKAVASAPNFP